MARLRRHPALLTGLSLAMLALYVVASFGVIPAPRVIAGWLGRAAGERYPCEGCGCGCASAAECWTRCCCHSEHQRLVWAIRNGVMPPEIVGFDDEQWLAAANAVSPGSASCALCVERIKGQLRRGIATRPAHGPACGCAGDGGGCRGGVCGRDGEPSGSVGDAPCGAGEGDRPRPPRRGAWMSALSCKGLHTLLTIALPPSPPVRAVEIILPEPAVFVPERPEDAAYASRALDVPEPPPRSAAAPG